jgi:hypothetical protein
MVLARNLGFTDQPISRAQIQGVPLELQILGVLRVLGRGTCFDGIEEITGASAEVHRTFFHKFIEKFSKTYYKQYVYLPRDDTELEKTMLDYQRMGLPGVLGSTDCVHVKWERCPVARSNSCTGKEGYPTLAWQCTVNHKLRFMSVSKAFFGSTNDKTICKFDSLTANLHAGKIYKDVKYELYTSDGDTYEEKGVYLICDGGFCQWRELMTGFKVYSRMDEAQWSSQMELTRKDVERCFGILKGRFRCLKLPVLLQKKQSVDYLFSSCVILHNMILSADGRDSLWEKDVRWDGNDGEHDIDDEEWSFHHEKR